MEYIFFFFLINRVVANLKKLGYDRPWRNVPTNINMMKKILLAGWMVGWDVCSFLVCHVLTHYYSMGARAWWPVMAGMFQPNAIVMKNSLLIISMTCLVTPCNFLDLLPLLIGKDIPSFQCPEKRLTWFLYWFIEDKNIQVSSIKESKNH